MDGTLFHDHPSGEHDLLIDTRNLKIPGPALVCGSEGDLYTVYRHSHHGDLLYGIVVRRGRSPLSIGKGAVDMLLVQLRVGLGLGPEVGGEVEGRGGGMGETGTTRVSKRCGVDLHCPEAVDRCWMKYTEALVVRTGGLGKTVRVWW